MKESAVRPKFKVGDRVYKPKGYMFPGTVMAVFANYAGEWRYVVESEMAMGLLHIYSSEQLRHKETEEMLKS